MRRKSYFNKKTKTTLQVVGLRIVIGAMLFGFGVLVGRNNPTMSADMTQNQPTIDPYLMDIQSNQTGLGVYFFGAVVVIAVIVAAIFAARVYTDYLLAQDKIGRGKSPLATIPTIYSVPDDELESDSFGWD